MLMALVNDATRLQLLVAASDQVRCGRRCSNLLRCYPSPLRWSPLISSTIRSLILDLTCVVPPLQLCSFFLLCCFLLLGPSCVAAVAGLVLVLLVLALGRSPRASFVWLINVSWVCCLISASLFCKCFSSSARTRLLALLTFAIGCSISRSRVKIVFTFCWVPAKPHALVARVRLDRPLFFSRSLFESAEFV